MEGSHQKGSNWYRCQFVYRRGIAAADAAGHPRVLGIREEVVLEPLFDFLGRRLFGPDRLRLLRDELATSLADGDDSRTAELAAVTRQLAEIDQAIRRQALRLEEHDDPNHPVVAAAKARIEELAGQRAALDEQRRQLEAHIAATHRNRRRSKRCSRRSQTSAPHSPATDRPSSQTSSTRSTSRSPTTSRATRSSSPPPSPPTSYRPQKDCNRLVGGRRILT